jgi:ankyrin repeat protein
LADLRGVVVEAASDGRIAVAATGEADARDPAAELQSRESRARGGGRGGRGGRAGGGGGADAEEDDDEARATRSNSYQDLVGKIGGLTPLLHACRQGHVEAAMALLDAGADVNQIGAGDRTSPLLMAIVNGRFDLAMRLLERGADPNLQSHAGVAPLYGVVNVYWAPHAFYPQPSTALETTSHLEMLEALLDAGADPNARLKMKVWYTGYNFDQSGVNEAGATAFWRAAQSGDVEAMRLLVARGADPSIANFDSGGGGRRPPGGGNPEADENAAPPADARSRVGSATSPLAVAAGAGYDGNFHRHAPYGRLPAVKCMIEEMGFDANERDPRGYTPMHHAAFRGDNEMILYLVSKGGDPKAVARSGETTVDRANGPVQRLQPFPETIALLEGMGAKNNHRAISR